MAVLTTCIVFDTLFTMKAGTEQDVGALAVALRRINHALDRHSRRQNVLLGLTAAQTLTLATLANSENLLSVTQLSQAVSLSQATTTDITLRLAAKGLIERQRDANDGRRTVLRLTEQGSLALQSAATLLPDSFVAQFDALPKARRRRLLASVLDLAALFGEAPSNKPQTPCVDSTEKSVSTIANPTGKPTKESTTR